MILLLVFQGEKLFETSVRSPRDGEVAFVWLNRADEKTIQYVLGDLYHCHPLVVEDCLHMGQRPKLDVYPDHAYIPFFWVTMDWDLDEMAVVFGAQFIVVLTDSDVPYLAGFEEELKRDAQRMQSTEHILYALLDHCTDNYLLVVDTIEDQITDMETKIYDDPFTQIGGDVLSLKRKLHNLRRIFTEERNVVGGLMHAQFPFTTEDTVAYFADVFDHLNRVVDTVDAFRDSLTGLLGLQTSLKADRMNKVMKTLTVVATFFLPASFIVGLYGINVKGVPEYTWKYGYEWVWTLLIVSTVALWWFFKKKKWF